MTYLRSVICCLLLVASSVAGAAPTLVPSRLVDGTSVDGEALGERLPVILVHGFGGSAEGWDDFLRAYRQNGAWRSTFKPYTFRYSSSTAEVLADPSAPRSITALGAALRDSLQAYDDKPAGAPDFGLGGKPVVVLAHSMGGLVARSMMQEHAFRDGERGGQKVMHLITLATPHHGTPLADVGLLLGIQTVSELSDTYLGFVSDMTWTNHDALDMAGTRCNPWLAQLNNYGPSNGASHGRCGFVPPTPLPGFFERIIAYGAGGLQPRDVDLGAVGIYRPGSSTSLALPHSYLRSGLSRNYPNDGIVPLASAQFEGPGVWQRGDAHGCDHRYIRRGYPEFVRTPSATYSDWAFCAAGTDPPRRASGAAGGYAVEDSIFGVPGGIADVIRNASEAERVFSWIESAHGAFLKAAGERTIVSTGFYFRYYASTQSYVGIMAGKVYYLGPASRNALIVIGTVADLLGAAQSAGL